MLPKTESLKLLRWRRDTIKQNIRKTFGVLNEQHRRYL